MASTLPVASFGFAAVRATAARRGGSNRLLKSFLAAPNLPDGIAARTHRLAATLSAGKGCFTAARRHLRAAARLDPKHAPTRYELGRAYEADPFGSDRLAARHFRAAARLERGNATYRAAFGRAAAKAGLRVSGVKALIRAAGLAPTDAAVLAVVVDGLLAAGRPRTARRLVGVARFRSRPGAVDGLWNRVRFAAARSVRRPLRSTTILPFVRPVLDGVIVRVDSPSRPRPHLAGRFSTKR